MCTVAETVLYLCTVAETVLYLCTVAETVQNHIESPAKSGRSQPALQGAQWEYTIQCNQSIDSNIADCY